MRNILALSVILAATTLLPDSASAQQVQTFNLNGKKCQTVRNCNFSRRARVRGCLSSFTCRRCRFVRTARNSRSRRGGGGQYRSVCGWGG